MFYVTKSNSCKSKMKYFRLQQLDERELRRELSLRSCPYRTTTVTNIANLSLCDSISWVRNSVDTVKGKNPPHDVDNAEKDGGRVRLHQNGQEDIRINLRPFGLF